MQNRIALSRGAASPAAGFTLVELLVAVGLTSIFLTMVATIFIQTQGAFSRARASIHMAQEAEAVFEAMAKDFASAALVTYFDGGGNRREGYFRCDIPGTQTADPPGPDPNDAAFGTAGPNFDDLPRLYFVKYADAGEGAEAPEPVMVTYRMEWRPLDSDGNPILTRGGRVKTRMDSDGDPHVRGAYRLVRRTLGAYRDNSYEIRNLDGTPVPVDDDGESGPLAFHVLWIQYRILAPDIPVWTDHADGWGDTHRLPRAVEVTLHMADPDLREEAVFTSRIPLPAPPPAPYIVVDVSGGPAAASYPVDYLKSAPRDLLTNDAYKTTRIVLRRIPAGTYTRGSQPGELGRVDDREHPPHQVTLTRGFYMGVFQITQAQYENVTGANPSTYNGMTRPVEMVSWNDVRGGEWPGDPPGSGQPAADTFVARLRDRTGLPFDLPTEAQWEYACRAGTTTSLNSGKNVTTGENAECPNMNEVGRYSWNWDDGRGDYSARHTTVGSYQPNAWGLFDLHGNVSEWCLDWSATYPVGPVFDPLGPGSTGTRVFRGGSWIVAHPGGCRAASRGWGILTLRCGSLGLRLSLSVHK